MISPMFIVQEPQNFALEFFLFIRTPGSLKPFVLKTLSRKWQAATFIEVVIFGIKSSASRGGIVTGIL
jgi:hypothetical protein